MNHIITVLSTLVQELPVGTNLALLHFLWMLVSGALLPNRGAIFPALKSIGLSDAATRRAWLAFRKGAWQMSALLVVWNEYVKNLPGWQARCYEGYRPIPADVTAFWRPALKKCPSKHYHPAANRALPAVIFGITGEVGEINGQRIALPRAFERVHPKDTSATRLWQEILKNAEKGLQEDEILVVDAGVKIRDLQEAKIVQYEIRLATNFTARRNFLPEHRKGRELRAEIWRGLVLNKTEPDEKNKTFDVYAIYDPDFDQPWLLAISVTLQPESVRAIYKDRWPVEQIPLSAKQMVGAHRQFVHNPESIQRLPELALLAGSILSFLAATLPAVPTGFWDRKPKRTPGRLRRTLMGKSFPKDALFSGQLREKRSATDHLPKGYLAVQLKNAQNTSSPAPSAP